MRLAALAIATLAATPVAVAQDGFRCDAYKKIIAEAASGFVAFKGEAVPGRTDLFMSTFNLDGFRCMVGDGPDKMFACYTGRPNEGAAKISYLMETLSVSRCFPDWKTRPPASIYQEGDPITDESVEYFTKLDGGAVSIGVLRAHMDTPEPAQQVLGIAVVWRSPPLGV